MISDSIKQRVQKNGAMGSRATTRFAGLAPYAVFRCAIGKKLGINL